MILDVLMVVAAVAAALCVAMVREMSRARRCLEAPPPGDDRLGRIGELEEPVPWGDDEEVSAPLNELACEIRRGRTIDPSTGVVTEYDGEPQS